MSNKTFTSKVGTMCKPLIVARAFFAPVTLAGTLAAVVLMLFPDWTAATEFTRTTIAEGESWRLFTGHLTHWSVSHAFWDVLMFLVLGTVCERRWPCRFLFCLPLAVAAISFTLWYLPPRLETYRGLSGLDTALFTLAAVGYLQSTMSDRNRALSIVISALLAALAAKIMYEAATGMTLFVNSADAFIPLPLVHLVGGLIGVGVAMIANPRALIGHWPRVANAI